MRDNGFNILKLCRVEAPLFHTTPGLALPRLRLKMEDVASWTAVPEEKEANPITSLKEQFPRGRFFRSTSFEQPVCLEHLKLAGHIEEAGRRDALPDIDTNFSREPSSSCATAAVSSCATAAVSTQAYAKKVVLKHKNSSHEFVVADYFDRLLRDIGVREGSGSQSRCTTVVVVGSTGSGKTALFNALRTIIRQHGPYADANASRGKQQDCTFIVDEEQSKVPWHRDRAIISHFIREPDSGLGNSPKATSGALDPQTPLVESASSFLTSVGLNSVPSWCSPYHTLSTGERYRAYLARLLQQCVVKQELASSRWHSKADARREKDANTSAESSTQAPCPSGYLFLENFAAHLDRVNARTCANSFARFATNGRWDSGKGSLVCFVNCSHLDMVRYLNPKLVIHTLGYDNHQLSIQHWVNETDTHRNIRVGIHIASTCVANAGISTPSANRTKKSRPPKTCSLCGKNFSSRGMLNKHAKKCTGLRVRVRTKHTVSDSDVVPEDKKKQVRPEKTRDANGVESSMNVSRFPVTPYTFGLPVFRCRRFGESDPLEGQEIPVADSKASDSATVRAPQQKRTKIEPTTAADCSRKNSEHRVSTSFRHKFSEEVRAAGLDVLVQSVTRDRGVDICDRLFDRKFNGVIATAVPRFPTPSTIAALSSKFSRCGNSTDIGVGVILGASGSLKSVIAARYFSHFAWVAWQPDDAVGVPRMSSSVDLSHCRNTPYDAMSLRQLFWQMRASCGVESSESLEQFAVDRSHVVYDLLRLLRPNLSGTLTDTPGQFLDRCIGSFSAGEQSIIHLALLLQGRLYLQQKDEASRNRNVEDDQATLHSSSLCALVANKNKLANGIVVDEFTSLLDRQLAAQVVSTLMELVTRHGIGNVVLVGCQVDDMIGSGIHGRDSVETASLLIPDWVFQAEERILLWIESTKFQQQSILRTSQVVAAGVENNTSKHHLLRLACPFGISAADWLIQSDEDSVNRSLRLRASTFRLQPIHLRLKLQPCPPDMWKHFRHHHYKTPNLSPSAESFVLFLPDASSASPRVAGQERTRALSVRSLVGFVATIRHNRKRHEGQRINPRRAHRTVVLPSWQVSRQYA
mgnify:FL=1